MTGTFKTEPTYPYCGGKDKLIALAARTDQMSIGSSPDTRLGVLNQFAFGVEREIRLRSHFGYSKAFGTLIVE